MPTVFLNGDFIDIKDASISVSDRGFLYGDGIFETMRAYGGEVFKLGEHLARMRSSARELQIPLDQSEESLVAAIAELLARNSLKEAYVRITLTRGQGPAGPAIDGDYQPTLCIIARELKLHTSEMYERGMHVITAPWRRDPDDPLPRHKSCNYLSCILARQHATAEGADEAIFLNSHDEVTEGTMSNIFLVKEGHVYTPSMATNILPGITRSTVLEICSIEEIGVTEAELGLASLCGADEVFLTNSTMEIMPVSRVDGAELDVPGEITLSIHEAYRQLI